MNQSVASEKPQCRICGTRRQRNLIFRYQMIDKPNWIFTIPLPRTRPYITCVRCDLITSHGERKEDFSMFPELFFGKPKYRYRNGNQIKEVLDVRKQHD